MENQADEKKFAGSASGFRMPLIDKALKAELTALYAASSRYYHGLAHIEAMLALAREHHAALSDPEAVEAAIWFHDAIYDSSKGDNEKRSAELAVQRLTGRTAPDRVERIKVMIEATATHQVPDFGNEAARRDAALFVDMDLSILGAPPERYDAYESAVRLEYAWVADAAWRAGRAAVLQGFLSLPHIFCTDLFRERYETQARRNIARSMEKLG
jgi:predicted metal-dependent HD superfamily phosphohydrolase